MYSVLDYSRMANDRVRMAAYARAIARVVKPGDVVLDLGAGTGIFAFLAAQAGARRVHAVDLNPAVLLVTEIARENGFGEQIVAHHQSSYDLVLDEPADVIIADLRGFGPLFDDNVPALRDARARLLKPGGVLIPARDRLMVAATEVDVLANRLENATKAFEARGFKASAVRNSVVNTVYNDPSDLQVASHVLTSTSSWATVDYAQGEERTFEGDVELTVQRPGTAHGLAVWFEATLLEGVTYTTAPGHSLTYSRLFLPLQEATPLRDGDRIRLVLRADMRGARWAWDTEVLDAAGKTKRSFRQATFLGSPASFETLVRASSSHRPEPSPRGARLSALLQAMNGQRTVADLGRVLRDATPADCPLSEERALEEARQAVERYGV